MHAYKVINDIIQKFVPPHLEYCALIWNPYYCKDTDTLEKVEEPQGFPFLCSAKIRKAGVITA